MTKRTLLVNEDAMTALVETMTAQRALIERRRVARRLVGCRRRDRH